MSTPNTSVHAHALHQIHRPTLLLHPEFTGVGQEGVHGRAGEATAARSVCCHELDASTSQRSISLVVGPASSRLARCC